MIFVISKYFNQKDSIALVKVVNYFRGKEVKQLHNALEDAKFLKEVFENLQTNKPPKVNPFTANDITYYSNILIAYSTSKRYSFDNFNEAAIHFTENFPPAKGYSR